MVITFASIKYIGTVAGVSLEIYVSDGTIFATLLYQTPIVNAQPYIVTGSFYVKALSRISGFITGATAGDDAYFYYGGYLMDTP